MYDSLKRVVLPETVTEIGEGAFSGRDVLEQLNLPAGVKTIGADAFSGCSNLTIYGVRGSYAETYAFENDIPFSASSMPEPDYGEMNATVTITVLSPDGVGLADVAVQVVNLNTTAIVRRGVTDQQGRVVIEDLQQRPYLFRCYDDVFEFADVNQTISGTSDSIIMTAQAPGNAYLTTSADSYAAEKTGGAIEVTVSSSEEWTASAANAWLTLDTTTGESGDVLTVIVEANEDAFRTGTIILSAGEKTKTVYIQQPGELSHRLPDLMITEPTAESMTVPYGDITISWQKVEGAGSYVISMRDLKTDDLLIHHERLADQTQTILNAQYFSDDHSYRVAVGAVPPGADSQDACVSWKEITFTVEEFINTDPVVFTGFVYELYDPTLVTTMQAIARDGMDPERMLHARQKAEAGIDYRPLPDCTVQIYRLVEQDGEAWWEFVAETYTSMYGKFSLSDQKELIAGEEYSFVITKEEYSFISSKIEKIVYTAQPGENQVIDVYGFSYTMEEEVEAFRAIQGYDVSNLPSGLFAEYFEYDSRKKSSYLVLSGEYISSDNAAILAQYKRNEGVVANVDFAWSGEVVKENGTTNYTLNLFKYGTDPESSFTARNIDYVPFNFAASFNGYIQLKGANDPDVLMGYMFRVRGDDGVKLRLGLPSYESYVESEWSSRGLSENVAEVDMTAVPYLNGTVMQVGIVYYNKADGGEANLIFEYSTNKGKSWNVVPDTWLYLGTRQISVLNSETLGGINYAAQLAQSNAKLANYGDHLVAKMVLDLGYSSINSAMSVYNTETVLFSKVPLSSQEKLVRVVSRGISANISKAVFAAVVKDACDVSTTEEDLWSAIKAELLSKYQLKFDTVYDVTTGSIDGIGSAMSLLNALSDNPYSDANLINLQNEVLNYCSEYAIGDLSDLDGSSGNVEAGYSTLFTLAGTERKELESSVISLDSNVKTAWGFANNGFKFLNKLISGSDANTNRAALSLMYAETGTIPDLFDACAAIVSKDQGTLFEKLINYHTGKPYTYSTRAEFNAKLNRLTDREINMLLAQLQNVDLESLLYKDLLKLTLDATYSHYKKLLNGGI